jgi:hypothetical protein
LKTNLLFSLLFVTSFCFAQNEVQDKTPDATKWQIGLLLVPQYTVYQNASETASGHYKAIPSFGFAYGVQIARSLPNNWAVAGEVLLSQQGQNYEPNIALAKSVDTYQRGLDFLKIPIFIQKNVNITKSTVFNADIGVQADILTKAQYYKDGAVLQTKTFDGSDERNIYTPINVSGIVKTGLTFKANDHLAVVLQVRADATIFSPEKTANPYWQSPFSSINKTDLAQATRSNTQIATLGVGVGVAYSW